MIASEAIKTTPEEGNGVNTSFTFTMKTWKTSDLVVLHIVSGVEDIEVLDVDYTAALNADQEATPGGTITWPKTGSPLPAGEFIQVYHLPAFTQQQNLLNPGAFEPRTVEDMIDRVNILASINKELAARCLQVPRADSPAPTVLLPVKGSRNGYLHFDASGNAEIISALAGNLVNDTSPQLGGDLDCNGFDILFDDLDGIHDDSDNETLIFGKAASAVNYAKLTNAATGNDVIFETLGDDPNVDLLVRGKGTGAIIINPSDLGIGTTAPTLGQLQISGNPASGSAPNRPRIGLEDTAGGSWLIQPWTVAGDGDLRIERNTGTGDLRLVPTGGEVIIDNLTLDGNTIKSTSGGLLFEGVAGQAIAFNDAQANVDIRLASVGNANLVHIDSSANLFGVGGVADLGGLMHVKAGDSGVATASSGAALVLENDAAVAFNILTPNTGQGQITFGDPDNNAIGGIFYAHTTDGMIFRAGTLDVLQLFSNRAGINTTTVNAAACLQLDSTTQGLLLPRMTTTQRNAISSPPAGLLIYNTTTAKANLYTTAWEAITSV